MLRNLWRRLDLTTVAAVSAVLLVASVAALVQAYMPIKLVFVALFVWAASRRAARLGRSVVYLRLVVFYAVIALVGTVWGLIAMMKGGTYFQGALDGARLYGVWSMAFLVLYSLFRSGPSLPWLHWGLVLAGISISLLNLGALLGTVTGWALVAPTVRDQLALFIGIHDDYIQLTSKNIGPLFVIVPYLVAIQFRPDASALNSRWTKVALVLSIGTAAVSGRRGLWLVVAFSPFMVLALALVTGGLDTIRKGGRRFLAAYGFAATLAVLALSATQLAAGSESSGLLGHVQEAFSGHDERSIQKGFLLARFAQDPLLGTGFGAYAGYLRSEESPWIYELTYHQMLANLGVTGMAVLIGLFGAYFALVAAALRRYQRDAAIPFAMLVGLACLFVGAYADPYFGSFDYLFFIGFLPFLATFKGGFGAGMTDGAAGNGTPLARGA